MEKKFFICEKCGNVVFKAVDSGIVPFCCGQKMVELVAKTTDMAAEKHVPIVAQIDDHTVRVEVGSVAHPMVAEHHICFVYLETKRHGIFKWLEAGDAPVVTFPCEKGDFVRAYEYCNIHGLWKTEVIAYPAPHECNPNRLKCFMLPLLLILSSLGICPAQTIGFNNNPVASFNLQRYLGEWYEIARYDHRFERGMSHVMAVYNLNANGGIDVRNSGWKNGTMKVSKGWAKYPNPATNPGLLRVSFFRPFYSDYRVLLVSPNYDYALVGSKTAKYLWLLSRTPQLSEDKTAILLCEAKRRGYELDQLLWIPQGPIHK